ncbi:MAG TPA: acyl-CoA dehydrogenase family protein [Candidatus Binataceae bacterium]|nr:acyl-CoA dehydrogenase family protein [Candidatus Binataceae bacterium]
MKIASGSLKQNLKSSFQENRMIDFEFEPQVIRQLKTYHGVAENMMRPISREYDEREHDKPWDFIEMMWAGSKASAASGGDAPVRADGPRLRTLYTCLSSEELCWGDAGLFVSMPNAGLGGAAVAAAGTPEQKDRFLKRFSEGKPKWGAMAITEPGCGSDSAAVATTATREGDYWVLNGTKIFCTSGQMAAEKSEGFVVVWASVDKRAGRAGIKPFVVEHNTPGMIVTRVENKLGIRVSDTAMLSFDNCRVPLENLLGSPEVKPEGGFKDVMATFDATRPIVAAMATGVGRAALDHVRDFIADHQVPLRYGISLRKLGSLERDFMEMEVQLKAARLLTWRAAWMLDMGQRNSLEASMAKAKAGKVVTLITQKAVELLGPLGYSRTRLVEKWMRDAKINDIYEGTQQINLLIVARRILGYSSKELN